MVLWGRVCQHHQKMLWNNRYIWIKDTFKLKDIAFLSSQHSMQAQKKFIFGFVIAIAMKQIYLDI